MYSAGCEARSKRLQSLEKQCESIRPAYSLMPANGSVSLTLKNTSDRLTEPLIENKPAKTSHLVTSSAKETRSKRLLTNRGLALCGKFMGFAYTAEVTLNSQLSTRNSSRMALKYGSLGMWSFCKIRHLPTG